MKKYCLTLSAFSLTEVLACTVIIIVLIGIALPIYIQSKNRAYITQDLSNARQIGQSMELYLQSNENSVPSITSSYRNSINKEIYASKRDQTPSGFANYAGDRFLKKMQPGTAYGSFPTKVSYIGVEAFLMENDSCLNRSTNGWAYMPSEMKIGEFLFRPNSQVLRINLDTSVKIFDLPKSFDSGGNPTVLSKHIFCDQE